MVFLRSYSCIKNSFSLPYFLNLCWSSSSTGNFEPWGLTLSQTSHPWCRPLRERSRKPRFCWSLWNCVKAACPQWVYLHSVSMFIQFSLTFLPEMTVSTKTPLMCAMVPQLLGRNSENTNQTSRVGLGRKACRVGSISCRGEFGTVSWLEEMGSLLLPSRRQGIWERRGLRGNTGIEVPRQIAMETAVQ